VFYTTYSDDGAIVVTCGDCRTSVSCPDAEAAAAEIRHHRCAKDAA